MHAAEARATEPGLSQMTCHGYASSPGFTQLPEVEIVDSARYDLFLNLVDVGVAGDLETMQAVATEYALRYALGICICSLLVLVGTTVSCLPCMISRCFLCRYCCRQKEAFIQTGYPRMSSEGWHHPCCTWVVLWFVCVVTVLVLLLTFDSMVTAVDTLICLANATLVDTGVFLVDTPPRVVGIVAAADAEVQAAVDGTIGVLQTLRAGFLAIDANVSAIAAVTAAQCAQLAASLNSGSGAGSGLAMDCAPVDDVLGKLASAASDLADEVDAVEDAMAELASQRDDVESYLADVQDCVVPFAG